jgi:hypothetical protein
VRPGRVCGCGTTRVRLPTVGVLRGENQAFSPGQPLRSRNPTRCSERPIISDTVGVSSVRGGEDVKLHFLDAAARLRTVKEIRRRLKPGAPFVAVHSSFPQEKDARAVWLSRYAAYAVASGADPDKVTSMKAAVEAHLALLTPEEDAAILREAGFADVDMFYAAFTWRGWVAYA